MIIKLDDCQSSWLLHEEIHFDATAITSLRADYIYNSKIQALLGSLFRISVKQQRKSSNMHKTKHVLSFIHVYTFLLSPLKYTSISSLIYSDSFFYFITWNENTIVFIHFLFQTRVYSQYCEGCNQSINVVISYSCQRSHLQQTQWVYSHGQR